MSYDHLDALPADICVRLKKAFDAYVTVQPYTNMASVYDVNCKYLIRIMRHKPKRFHMA